MYSLTWCEYDNLFVIKTLFMKNDFKFNYMNKEVLNNEHNNEHNTQLATKTKMRYLCLSTMIKDHWPTNQATNQRFLVLCHGSLSFIPTTGDDQPWLPIVGTAGRTSPRNSKGCVVSFSCATAWDGATTADWDQLSYALLGVVKLVLNGRLRFNHGGNCWLTGFFRRVPLFTAT